MTPEGVLVELLDRVGSQRGAAVIISALELSTWPPAAVESMKRQGLLTKAAYADTLICPGCEHECVMAVDVVENAGDELEAFIVCNERDDINRVPVSMSHLDQWQASGDSVASLLAGLLGLHRSGAGGTDAARWEVGIFKGTKHSSHVVLVANGNITLTVAGHSIPLVEVLALGNALQVDRQRLNRLVDQPVNGGGDGESAAQRRERLKKRVDAEKARGSKAFQKDVAAEEGISVSRLKQLLKDDTKPAKSGSRW